MTRRAVYMYGDGIPKNKAWQIGTVLGMTSSTGSSAIVKPTNVITKDGVVIVDGYDIDFQLTPGTEAPSEMVRVSKPLMSRLD